MQVPEGFRAVRFTDDDADVVYEGIVRIGAETWSGGLMPFVTVDTAQQIVSAWQQVYPTAREAHADKVIWIDLVPMLGDYSDLVVYDEFDHPSGYDADGYPVDGNAWGTVNLLDDDAYRAAYPGGEQGERVWIDLGSVGLVWHELPAYEISDLQACELETLPRVQGITVTVTEERDSMGFPRVTVASDDRDALLAYVREHWGDDEATGGWYSEHVLPQVQS